MGTIWAYDFFFLFFGPEMTQEERDEEAEATKHYERLKKEGMSLTQIGNARARGEFKGLGMIDALDEEKGQRERDVVRVESKDLEIEQLEN